MPRHYRPLPCCPLRVPPRLFLLAPSHPAILPDPACACPPVPSCAPPPPLPSVGLSRPAACALGAVSLDACIHPSLLYSDAATPPATAGRLARWQGSTHACPAAARGRRHIAKRHGLSRGQPTAPQHCSRSPRAPQLLREAFQQAHHHSPLPPLQPPPHCSSGQHGQVQDWRAGPAGQLPRAHDAAAPHSGRGAGGGPHQGGAGQRGGAHHPRRAAGRNARGWPPPPPPPPPQPPASNRPPPPTCRALLLSPLSSAPPRAAAAGGESTTMALVAERWGLIPELQRFAAARRPVWGTCAGLIFLANRASGGWLGWGLLGWQRGVQAALQFAWQTRGGAAPAQRRPSPPCLRPPPPPQA